MAKPRASTTERGLGHAHRKKRDALPPPQGRPCPYCHKPMWPGMKLDADHSHARALGGTDSPLRWAHASCNRREGQRLKVMLESQRKRTRTEFRTELTW